MDRIEDYFGFDLGDGESAVAWLGSFSQGPALMLEIAGKKSVISALGRCKDGCIIGEQACYAEVDELSVRFKSRFLSEPDWAARAVRGYAEAVLKEIRKTGRMGEDSAFFVGCPSGWDAAARERYRRLFLAAGFPQVEIVSESRAAFLFVRESGKLQFREADVARPTLVIDAGSSTTDFTYIRDLKAVDLYDFGENSLGGGLIDKALLSRCVDAHPQRERIMAVFKACPPYEARCELEARKVKEMYFTRRMQGAGGAYRLPCESSVKLYYEDPPVRLDIACSEALMEDILDAPMALLKGQSYRGAYRKALKQAGEALGSEKPELILLTGGASRMDFMGRIAGEVFPQARLLVGAEPEFSIARGLCYALRIDRRTQRFEEDVRALIASDKVEDIVDRALPGLFEGIAPVLAEELVEEIGPTAFRRWKRGEIATMDDMSRAMGEHLSASLREGALKEGLQQVTQNWIDGIRPELEALTDPICLRCHLPAASLRIRADAPTQAGNLSIDAEALVNLNLLQTLVDLVVAMLVAMLLGGSGTALLMAGPLGLAISFVIGFVASRLGTTLLRSRAGSFNLPMALRALFSQAAFRRALKRRQGELARDIRDKLQPAGAGSGPAARELSAGISQAIERQLSDMAQRARLLIH